MLRLLLSSAVAIVLAFAYTHAPQKHWGIEAALTSGLLVSLVGGAAYLIYHYRRQVSRRLRWLRSTPSPRRERPDSAPRPRGGRWACPLTRARLAR